MFYPKIKPKYLKWNSPIVLDNFEQGVKLELNRYFQVNTTNHTFSLITDATDLFKIYDYHYVFPFKQSTTEPEMIENILRFSRYLTVLTIPYLKNYDVYEGELTLQPQSTITKNFDGENDGMTEISPINANLGDVSTPNTKSKFKAQNEQTDVHDSFENRLKLLNLNRADYNNIIKYFGGIYSRMIKELTQIR